MLRSMIPSDIFSEMERLQREMQNAFEFGPSIRGVGRGGFPALSIRLGTVATATSFGQA